MRTVAHIITKLELGGAQQNTLYTVENLDRSKYKVILISGNGGLLDSDAKKIKDIELILIPELKHEINLFWDAICFFKLYFLFRNKKIDILHTHSSKAGILGRLAGFLAKIPIIIHTVHGFSFNGQQNFIKKNLFVLFERITAKITHKLIVVTVNDIDKGLNAKVGNHGQYILIHSGIDIEKFKFLKINIDDLKREFKIPLDDLVVGMIACLKPQKAPCDFVCAASEVVKKIKNCKFMLIGDGDLRQEVQSLIKELKLEDKIILTGWRKDVENLIHIFDVFVLSSLWEGLPRVFPQVMCAGLPVVATKVDGASEVIKDGETGFLVEPKDYKGLAQKICLLLSDESLRIAMGNKARLRIDESFDIKKMVQDIDELYQIQLSP
ncbi:MAG: glycosyltransferase family 4 protein [Candidatus Firestonebacteria bacterium]